MNDKTNEPSEFSRVAQTEGDMSLVAEFVYFLKTNKKWWLVPIILMLLLFGGLLMLSGSAAAPFIYSLF